MQKVSRKSGLMKRRDRHGYVFISPFLIGFLLFMLVPLVQSFIFSFKDIKIIENGYTLLTPEVGNYRFVTAIDTDYRQRLVDALWTTFRDTIVVIPFSFFSALILNKKFPGRTLARAIFFLPVIVSVGVLANTDSNNTIMNMMMSRDPTSAASSLHTLFSASKLIENLFAGSLPDSMLQFVTVATNGIYDIIMKSGLQIVIFMGGLNTIPDSLYEASYVEGATAWVNFWKLTLPMCGPYILLNVIYSVIDSFTNTGNPIIARVRSEMVSLSAFGVASAAVWLYFTIIFVVLGVLYALIQRRVFYYND